MTENQNEQIAPNEMPRPVHRIPPMVAVLSGKGGTGKSVIAATLACALAHCGRKVLLVDADLFTGGLSYYVLAEYPRSSDAGLRDIFTGDAPLDLIRPILIPNPFCQGDLWLLPSIVGRNKDRSELALGKGFRSLESFVEMLQGIISNICQGAVFDHVIFDTRGGTDITSVGAAIAAGAFLVVTEADKTSWDVGALLLDTIYAETGRGRTPTALGFILNKNVLPSAAIEIFLRKHWNLPHLATIPLDPLAIQYYQEDKIPIAEDLGIPFVGSLMPAVRKLFVDERWTLGQIHELTSLEHRAKSYILTAEAKQKYTLRAERFSVLLKIYGTLLATALLASATLNLMWRDGSWSQPTTIILITIPAVLIFFMTASDPKVITRIVESFLPRRYKD